MTQININDGNISSVNLRQQSSNPSTPANGIRLFDKASGIYFVDNAGVISGPLGAIFTPGGRLSMVSGTAVTTTDIYSGTSLWYNPYVTDMLPLWDGNKIVPVQFEPTQISLAGLSGTSSLDVFSYLNSGVPAFETSMWTSPTVRAINISMQHGKLCKVGDATRLYVGSFYTSSAGKTDDGLTKRNVWNYYNRIFRRLYVQDESAHNYTTGTWRSWNGNAALRWEFMTGIIENPMEIRLTSQIETCYASIGIDVTNTASLPEITNYQNNAGLIRFSNSGLYYPALGNHFIQITEYGLSGATQESAYLTGAVWG